MAVIHVPKPTKSSMNPGRSISSLLRMQIEHLLEAERRLPFRYHSGVYANAIQTEREAAAYIRCVTEAIHRAHADAEHARSALKPTRRVRDTVPEAQKRRRSGRRKKTVVKKKRGRSK